jgi:hypothetical protein
MYQTKIKHVVRLLVLMTIVGLGLQTTSVAMASDLPELPAQCVSIAAPAGTELAFHAYARGVQIYRWNGSSWDFVAPVATLYAEANYFGEVGSHYVGPTWESKSGSKFVGKRVMGTGCTPDPNAIAWLLLEKVSASGPGIFAPVTHVQRVNTTGGIPPADAGLTVGEVKEVAYTAEYYFYRPQD